MANSLKSLSENLAKNLNHLRTRRGLSQSAVARLAGVPRSTVTNLESGSGNPSLMNLARISGALQVTLEELLAAPRASCKLVRSAELPFRKRGQGETYVYKLLPDPIPGMEIDRMELAPGDRIGGIPHVSGTKEYLTCVAGEITVHVGGGRYDLKEGDVLAFPGDQTHSYANSGRKKAVGVSVVALAPPGS